MPFKLVKRLDAYIMLDTAGIVRGDILVNDCCVNTIREFGLYAWDTAKQADRVLKIDDHAMDALRYFVYTLRLADPKEDGPAYVSPFRGRR